jgi:hypothetical protein
MIIVVLMAALIAPANAAVVVYEGFDYAAGSAISGQGAAVDGWLGAWTATGTYPPVVIAGQTYDLLPVEGGAAQRPNKTADGAMSRMLSSAAQAALTADNTTVWFSVLMDVRTASVPSNIANSFATLILGDTALTGGSGTTAAPIGAGGNAIGVSFVGAASWASILIQGVTYKGGTLTQDTTERTTVGDVLVMVVGKIEWAPDGSDDSVSLYLIEDPTAALPAAPFSTMAVDLNQTTFNVVSIGDAQASVFDEIRFGNSYAEVTYGPTPGNGEIVPVANPLTLSWFNPDPNYPTDSVYVDVWFGTEPNELSANYDMTKIVDAATTGQDAVSVDVDASVAGTYYWWVDTYIYGSANINDPNKIAGSLYSFVGLNDTPPSVVIDTPNQMTWSGEGVPLAATVTDDSQSAVTIAWTADAVSMADPNLTITIAGGATSTPTVTITKDAEGLGLRTVTMTVAVSDTANPTPVTASCVIYVYDDACQMARLGEGKIAVDGVIIDTDFNNDCVTNLEDFAQIAAAWLGDYSSTGPLDR